MAGKTAFVEKKVIGRFLRRLTTAVSGSNASTSNILVSSSTGFDPGDIIKLTSTSTYHLVTAVPDSTHVTISPATASAPTTGSMEAWGYLPAAVYIGLFTAAPSDAGGGTEVSGGSYARVQVTQADGSWAAPSGTPDQTSNSGVLTFPAPTSNWGLVTHTGMFDSPSGGNLLYWAALTQSKTINNGDAAPSFSVGALTLSED